MTTKPWLAYQTKAGDTEILGQVQNFEWHAEPQRHVWLVLRISRKAQEAVIIGVFDTQDAALAACTTPLDVMGPIALNVDYGHLSGLWWPHAEYPLAGLMDGSDETHG